MAKERIEKKEVKIDNSGEDINEILIENFVGLQKAMTNLSIKFESLANQTARLLEILELSSKEITKDGFQDNKELTKKIEMLLEQNRIITTRIISMEEKMQIESPKQPAQSIIIPQIPKSEMSSYEAPPNMPSEYMPSIGNKPKPLPKS